MNDSGAIFLDADGTLWKDEGPGSIFAFSDYSGLSLKLKRLGILFNLDQFIIISNQTCVARGISEEETLKAKIDDLIQHLKSYSINVFFAYCPHHPNAEVERYRIKCLCRKPAPGLILSIASNMGINLSMSVMIGDRITDAQAASRAGIPRTYLLLNKYSLESNEHTNTDLASSNTIFKLVAPRDSILDINELEKIL